MTCKQIGVVKCKCDDGRNIFILRNQRINRNVDGWKKTSKPTRSSLENVTVNKNQKSIIDSRNMLLQVFSAVTSSHQTYILVRSIMNNNIDPLQQPHTSGDRHRRDSGTGDAPHRGGTDINRMDHRQHPLHRRHPQRSLPASAVSESNLEWFRGAPLSKGILLFSVVVYLIVNRYHNSSLLDYWRFNSFFVFQRHQGFRFISSKLVFGSNTEAIIGVSLQLFLYRKFERELGSYQFLKYVLAVYAITIAQEIVLFHSLSSYPLHWSYSGPYCVLSALFLYYHWYIPRLHPRFVSLFNFHFSEKSLYYFWFIYLLLGSNREGITKSSGAYALSGLYGSMFPVVMGMISSTIYYFTAENRYFLLLDRTVYATIVQPIIHRFGFDDNSDVPIIRGTAQHPEESAIAASAGHQRIRQRHLPNVTPAVLTPGSVDNNWMQEIPLPEPDMAAVEQLTAMGFPQSQVLEALRQSHNNVEHAANRLLSGE